MITIGIVLGSTRAGRNGQAVAEWVYRFAQSRHDGAAYEWVDLREYDLPFFGAEIPEERRPVADSAIEAWSRRMASFDGYVFVTPEYNHSTTGVLKNALDYLNAEVNDKACGFVGYGGLGGARAIEHLRLIAGELQMADVRTSVAFLLRTDFENMTAFRPADSHAKNAHQMLDQLLAWSTALKTVREGRAKE